MLKDGDLHLTASGKTAALTIGLETERWYHVIVVHNRTKLTLEKKANANVRPRCLLARPRKRAKVVNVPAVVSFLPRYRLPSM